MNGFKKMFKRRMWDTLNLNCPITFNEKIQWLKLYDRTELHTKCADKYLVREYVSGVLGEDYLIPLLLHTSNLNKISADVLPSSNFVIKTNHDCGTVIIVKDKDSQNWNEVRCTLRHALKRNYYLPGREWQYKNIFPRIIVEKLLLDDEGNIPHDFKLFCFNGKFKMIQVDTNRFQDHKRNFYDRDWNLLDVEVTFGKAKQVSKPNNLSELITIAEKLAKPFIFVRVDLYVIQNKIYFGELTFHPDSGFTIFSNKKYDYELGDCLSLPINN